LEKQGDGSWIGAVILASILGIVATSIALPDRVATHFDASGAANGFMTRAPYLVFMTVFALLLPLLVLRGLRSAMNGAINSINVPNREYWLDPARREESLRWLHAHAARLAAGISAFAFVLHAALIYANHQVPPRLDPGLGFALLGASLIGVLLWGLGLMRHFRRP